MPQINDAEFIDLVQNYVDRAQGNYGSEHLILNLAPQDLTDMLRAKADSKFSHFSLFLAVEVGTTTQQSVIIAAMTATNEVIRDNMNSKLFAFQKHDPIPQTASYNDNISSVQVDVKKFLNSKHGLSI